MINTVIIGAGPYGLSIAAHLRARRVAFRIFGSPMDTWLRQMPRGMRLKSEGFASSLYDPESSFTLAEYCKLEGIPYADIGIPVPLETFTAYGLAFQKRFVPELENKYVVSLRRAAVGFEICLADGEIVATRKVVVAVGITHFKHLPPILNHFSEEYVTHSSSHSVLNDFNGCEVAVIGAGASAVDLAALLLQAGAIVHLVARRPKIKFHTPPDQSAPSILERVRVPITGIGPGWRLLFCAEAPQIFRRLPERLRLEAVKRILGPAPGWFMKDEVVDKVPFHLGVTVTEAGICHGRVRLQLTDGDGGCRTLATDHVIAATGYRVDLKRLTFLDSNIRAQITSVDRTPVLSSNFESSVSGLYFVGVSAANSFGPLLRFAFGAKFAARRLARHFARVGSG